MTTASAVLPPEARVLLTTVRGTDRPARSSGPPIPERGAGPPPEALDWEALYALLVRERASAALHPAAERLGLEIPSPWNDRFRALGAVSGFRQQALLEELERVVERLADEGVRVSLLKGAALALTVYPHPLDRPMGDLDLLVTGGRVAEAWEILREAGWVWHRESYPMELYENRQHLPPLEDPGRNGRVVELHDALFLEGHPFRFGPRELTESARPLDCGSATVLVPGPTAHLVYTCLHFAWAHCLGKGGWRTFRDVQALVSARDFRWSEFERLARASRAERPCYWTLRLARELGGVDVPAGILAALEPTGFPAPVLRALERHFTLVLFHPTGGCPSVAVTRGVWRAAMVPAGRPSGSTRPWEHDRGFVELQRARSGSADETILQRLVRHVRGVRPWLGYLGSVVAGRESLPPAEPTGGAVAAQEEPSAQVPDPEDAMSSSSR